MKNNVTNSYRTTLTDEDLVAKIVKTNDAKLFEELYDRYANIVYNKCYSFSKTTVEAQDLTQEVFIKLYLKLYTFQFKSKFSTWLYTFTYNMCINYVTRDKEKNVSNKSVQLEDQYFLNEEIEEQELFQLKENRLKMALELIDPEEKMLLFLKYQDDVSIKELAANLEIGESAVKMRLSRAKSKLVTVYNSKTQ